MPRIRPFHSAHLHILPNGTGLEFDQPNHLGPFHSRVSIGLLCQHGEGFRENAHRTTCIRTRERRARSLADAQMIMLMRVGLGGGFDSAQARDPAQLGAHHRHKMIPAFERFVVGIAVMPLDDFPKLSSIDRFQELPKDAIPVLHARPLSEFSTTRKYPVHAGFAGHALRHSESFPGQPCACGERSKFAPRISGEGAYPRVRPC